METGYLDQFLNKCRQCGGKAEMITPPLTAEDFLEVEKTHQLPNKKYQIYCTCCLTNKSIRSADLFEVVRDWNKENPAKRY